MALIHARGMALMARNVTLNSTSLNGTIYNSTTSDTPASVPLAGSWFGRLMQKLPGGSWVKNKFGRLIYGPTYGMTAPELKAYIISQKRARQLEYLRREKEAEFKVAKYLVLHHPDFYWSKYIDKFDKGSEERKRGFFLFILTNKEKYGHYYGRLGKYISWVNQELIEMGLKPATMNIIEDIVSDGDSEENKAQGNRIRKRSGQIPIERLPEGDRTMFNEMERLVVGIDLSTFNRQFTIPPRRRNYKARQWRKTDED